jgi:hypothetical protein
MPGIWAGWRNDWVARDAGEVVEVVETGLSAKKKPTLSATRFPLFTDAVTRRSNQRAAVNQGMRFFNILSSTCFQRFLGSEIQHVPSMLQQRLFCCSQKPHPNCQRFPSRFLKADSTRTFPPTFNLSNSCKRKDPGLPFLVLKP